MLYDIDFFIPLNHMILCYRIHYNIVYIAVVFNFCRSRTHDEKFFDIANPLTNFFRIPFLYLMLS